MTKPDGTPVGSGTTDSSGFLLNIPLPDGAGTYIFTLSKSGFITAGYGYPVTCTSLNLPFILLPTTSNSLWTFTVTGCCSDHQNGGAGSHLQALGAATITVTDPDGSTQTKTTDATGTAKFPITFAGTYSYVASKSRFGDQSGSQGFPTQCPTGIEAIVTMNPASGYLCDGPDSTGYYPADPAPSTLHLTDGQFGACVLAYNGTSAWVGTIAASVVAFPSCGCPAAGFTITYTLADCANGGGLGVSYTSCDYGECLAGTFTRQANCPADPSSSTTCAGKADGTFIFQGCGTTGVAVNNFAITQGGGPFEATATIPAGTCTTDYPWDNDTAITITE